MAVISQQTQFNNEDEENNPSSTALAPVQVTSGPAANIASVAPSPGKPTSSGRFTNLSKYLNANKQANVAGNLSQKLESNAQDLQNEGNQAYNQFEQQANPNRLQYREGVVKSAIANPVGFLQDPEYNVLQRQLGTQGGYAGPSGIDNEAQLRLKAENLKNQAEATNTEQGRFGLLRSTLGGQKYTSGQQRLDQLLLQKGGQVGSLQEKAAKVSDASTKNIADNIAAARDLSQKYSNEAQKTIQQTNAAIKYARDTALANAAETAKDANERRAQVKQNLIGELSRGEIRSDLGNLGDTSELYGVDPTKFLLNNSPGATARNISTPEQAARIAALSRISGTIDPEWENASTETYQPQGFAYDIPGLRAAIEREQQRYQAQFPTAAPQSIYTPINVPMKFEGKPDRNLAENTVKDEVARRNAEGQANAQQQNFQNEQEYLEKLRKLNEAFNIGKGLKRI